MLAYTYVEEVELAGRAWEDGAKGEGWAAEAG